MSKGWGTAALVVAGLYWLQPVLIPLALAVLLTFLAPGGLSQARRLCKRLRSQYPGLKIVIGRWGLHDEMDADREQLLAAGADHVETTVLDMQRTLAMVGFTRGPAAPESSPTPAPEVLPWPALVNS